MLPLLIFSMIRTSAPEKSTNQTSTKNDMEYFPFFDIINCEFYKLLAYALCIRIAVLNNYSHAQYKQYAKYVIMGY